jgi:5-dehydro-4-deoxyglucarate dehydratase
MNDLSRRLLLTRMGVAGAALASSPFVLSAKNRTAPKRTMTELRQALRGVHNFMVTPFRSNYDLDAEGLRRNVAYHAAGNTENMTIVVGGGLGELFTLDPEEQKSLAAAAVAGAQGKMPVVVGAGGGYKLALRMARNAEEAGADAILLFSPPYGPDSADGVSEYFKAVAASVRIGVVLYPRGKEEFWPEVLKRMAALPNVVGFKDPSGGIEMGKAVGSLIQDQLLWVAEGETHALEALPAGSRAYTTAVATFVPEACKEFWKLGVAGNRAGMEGVLQKRIEPVVKVRGVKPGYGVSGIKVALEALGRAGGIVRPPGMQVQPQDRAVIAEIARNHSESSKTDKSATG